MGKKTCTIILKPSHNCNYHCIYCYDRFLRAKHHEILSVENCIKALEKTFILRNPDNFKFQVIWHGGEPTLLGINYLDTVMSYFKDKEYTIEWCMQTNGSLLNEEWFQLAKKYDLHIGLSWDGVSTDSTRLANQKDKKMNIFEIAMLCDKYSLRVGLLMVVTPNNANTLLASYELAKKLNLSISFNPLFGENINKEDYLKMAYGQLELFDYLLQQDDGEFSRPFEWIKSFVLGEWSNLCEFTWCSNKWLGIDCNGNITQCGKPWGDDLMWGNILDDNITWEKIESSPMSKLLADIGEQQWKYCKDCKWMSVCMNGCPFNGWDAETKTYHIDEDFCFYQKFLWEGFMFLINKHCNENTLRHKKFIEYLNQTTRGDLIKWKNYKYPTI